MPITFERHEADRAIVVFYDGALTVEEVDDAVMNTVMPFIGSYEPEPAHVIYDVNRLEIGFTEFIQYITAISKHSKQNKFPQNLRTHYVGKNEFVTRFRTWTLKQFQVETSAFDTIDEALQYIRAKNKRTQAGT